MYLILNVSLLLFVNRWLDCGRKISLCCFAPKVNFSKLTLTWDWVYLHPCIHLFPHARADTIMTMQVVEHDSQLTKFYQLTIFSLDPQFCTLLLSLYVTSSECWKISPFGSCLKKVSFKSQIHTAECSHHTISVHKMIQCKFITMW